MNWSGNFREGLAREIRENKTLAKITAYTVIRFSKNSELCTKREKFLRKMSPRLSQLNVAIAHRNYFRQNNLRILKLATYTKIEYHYSTLGANWQLFRWERIAKCSYSILSTQNIKFYWFVMKINTFLLPIWWYNRGLFPLGNKYFGVFVLNGLKPCYKSHVRQFLQNGVGSGYLVRQLQDLFGSYGVLHEGVAVARVYW